jgi:integrase
LRGSGRLDTRLDTPPISVRHHPLSRIALAIARDRAADALDGLRRGIDPKSKTITPTLRWALNDYLAARKDLKSATVRLYRFVVEQKLTDWLDKPLAEITGDMVEQRHRAIAATIGNDVATRYRGTGTANVVMVVLRILWNFAADRLSDLPQNPCRRLRRQWFAEPRRTRLVRADDMPAFYRAVMALPNPVARDWFLLMMYSGMRRTESGSLRWDDVDFAQRIIHLPAVATKPGRALNLPMCDVVHDLLVARRALGNAGGFVLPGNNARGHIVDTSVPIKQIEAMCGIRISAHDLRRTFITVAEGLDISPLAIKALVNHSIGNDLTSGYVVFGVERLREPAQRVADRLKALSGLMPVAGGKVRQLKSRLG